MSHAHTAGDGLLLARATDEGGRGLMLVAGLSPCRGVRQSARGKTVWAEIALPPE